MVGVMLLVWFVLDINSIILQYGYTSYSGQTPYKQYFPLTYKTYARVAVSILSNRDGFNWASHQSVNSIAKNYFEFTNEGGIGCSWIAIGY